MNHVAASDCERCRPGLVGQPVNTISSLAYVVSGAAVLRRERRHPTGRGSEQALGWAIVAAGLGSVAYHGPGTAAGRYAHDASLLTMLGLVTLADIEVSIDTTAPTSVVAAIPVVAAVTAHPALSLLAQAVAGTAATLGEVVRMSSTANRDRRFPARLAEAVVAGGGASAHVLGRSGGPWCRPERWIQPHGVWHVATAGAVWLRHRDLGGPTRTGR